MRRVDIATLPFQDRLDLTQGMVVIGRGVRDDAIGGCEDLEVAHVGVVRGEEHADVARDAREDHATDPEGLEQRVERGIEEA